MVEAGLVFGEPFGPYEGDFSSASNETRLRAYAAYPTQGL